MTSLTDKENPFSLKDDLKKEYQKLIEKYSNLKYYKRKIFKKRKTLSVKRSHFMQFA